MAADDGELSCSERKRKRKSLSNRPKLLVGDKVEVRSLKDGFRGSWRSGTVIASENQARRVQYDHLLYDGSFQLLIETIKVPPIVDGIIPASRVLLCNHRGLMRPLPPLVDFAKCSLHYGQCVDVYDEGAWWEGVIFDCEDSSECRTIFFPDTGDEIQFRIDTFRITQDWDEFTEDWKLRGKWLFLELVEEFEQEWPVKVSAKQIWHEVRVNKGFQKLMEWTSTLRGIWKNLVWEVIFDNCKLAVNCLLWELNSSGDMVQDAGLALPHSSETHFDIISRPEADSGNSLSVIAVENDGLDSRWLSTDLGNANNFISITEDDRLGMNRLTSSRTPCHKETPRVPPPAPAVLPFNQDERSKSLAGGNKHFRQSKSHSWLPAANDIVPRAEFCTETVDKRVSVAVSDSPFTSLAEPPHTSMEVSVMPPLCDEVIESEYCPQAVVDYYFLGSAEKNDNWKCYKGTKVKDLQFKAKKHLSAIGWSFWYIAKGRSRELRYTSPRGKSYNSLRTACKGYMDEVFDNSTFISSQSLYLPQTGAAAGGSLRPTRYTAPGFAKAVVFSRHPWT